MFEIKKTNLVMLCAAALLASKCDLCRERSSGPACVAACPFGACSSNF